MSEAACNTINHPNACQDRNDCIYNYVASPPACRSTTLGAAAKAKMFGKFKQKVVIEYNKATINIMTKAKIILDSITPKWLAQNNNDSRHAGYQQALRMKKEGEENRAVATVIQMWPTVGRELQRLMQKPPESQGPPLLLRRIGAATRYSQLIAIKTFIGNIKTRVDEVEGFGAPLRRKLHPGRLKSLLRKAITGDPQKPIREHKKVAPIAKMAGVKSKQGGRRTRRRRRRRRRRTRRKRHRRKTRTRRKRKKTHRKK